MKRIDLKKKKKKIFEFLKRDQYPNFIGTWNIENDSLCKEIINFFEENKDLQKKGSTGVGVNQSIKKTTDIGVTPNDLKNIKYKCLNEYIKGLYKCYEDYQNQWPFTKGFEALHVGAFNIQKYSPGDHFAEIHSERGEIATSHRVFAWMTYLNNVDDGGTTNFSHFNIKVKPETGKTLIWPAEWTHAHSGEILNSGVKYIVTGWIHFPYYDEEKNDSETNNRSDT
tara:strand:+ start:382 stop:1056 length:675 start_codon:yes stop_codon:yes gene_type:complete